MANYGYWTFGTNRCALQGGPTTYRKLPDGRVVAEKYPGNPAVVPDEFIIHALRHSRRAIYDFNRLYPTLDEISQQRLLDLVSRNRGKMKLVVDPQSQTDTLTRRDARSGVHL